MVAGTSTGHETSLHSLEIVFITLAASEYEKFTSFIGAIKIKSSQRCLTASSVDGEAADGFSWFKSTMKLNCMNKSSTWTPTGSNTAFLRQEVVGVSSTASVGEQETSLGRLVKVEPRNVSRTDSFILHLGTLINFLNLRFSNPRESCNGRLVSTPSQTVNFVHEVVLVPLASTVHKQFTPTFQGVVIVSELFSIAAA